jgi:hypothetical protein
VSSADAPAVLPIDDFGRTASCANRIFGRGPGTALSGDLGARTPRSHAAVSDVGWQNHGVSSGGQDVWPIRGWPAGRKTGWRKML